VLHTSRHPIIDTGGLTLETAISHEERAVERAVIGGSSAEEITGAAAVVLSILGLAHIAPTSMCAIAAIALGAALLLDGAEVLVGLAAVVLGILALLGIAPVTLVLVAMLALGASVLLTGSAVVGKMLTIFAA